ncbi:MAG: metalloregulator ArsR/SmtB family transcription factor [Bryobacteraceae bacterium]
MDATFAALADPVRRSILTRLSRSGEVRVTDLAKPYPISLNSVSKHIQQLERARLVERRRVGREYRIRFRPEPLTAAQAWIAEQRSFWAGALAGLDEAIAKSRGGGA